MSPNSEPQLKTESPREITEGLRDRYESIQLKPGIVHEIPPLENDEQMISGCENPADGVRQSLRAMIKVGDEFLGVVDVFLINRSASGGRPNILEGTAITRHISDGRADLIGFIGNNQDHLTIGRSHQKELNPKVSREQFSIGRAKDGSIGIIDLDSTNGTEVFMPSKNSKYGFETKDLNSKNPTDDIDFWSVKSALIGQELLEEAS